jgi:putative transposase
MKHRSHELRKGRVNLRDQTYHVTFTTKDRIPLFDDFYSARTAINALRDSDAFGFTHTWTLIVMPDHVHWLFELKGETLGRVVARVKSRVSRNIASVEEIWQRGYFDHALRQDEAIETVSAYIVNNPIRARIVAEIEQYSHWYVAWLEQH